MHDTGIRWLLVALVVALSTWGVAWLASSDAHTLSEGAESVSEAKAVPPEDPTADVQASTVEPELVTSSTRNAATPIAPVPAAALRLRIVRWPDDVAVAGARVRVEPRPSAPARELLASRNGRVSWVPNAEHEGWRLVAWAEGWGAATLDLSRRDLTREHVLRLTPDAAWVGRVEDPFGTPLAAEIVAWQWWPPRPSLLDDGHPDGPRLLSHQRRRKLQVFRSGLDGRFLVPHLPSEEHSELVLAVRGSQLASELLHVPLAPPDSELPPLVLRAQHALFVQLRDIDGKPLVGLELEIDDGPGRRFEALQRVSSDANGLVYLARHLGALSLRPRDSTWQWLTVRADGQPLRPNAESWLDVPAGVARVVIELGRTRRLVGRLRDEFDGRAIRGAQVHAELLEDDGTWTEVHRVESDASGAFDLRTPLEAQAGRLRLRAEAAAYEPWQLELLAGIPDSQGDLLLRPQITGGLLRGRVLTTQERPVIGADIRFWSAPPDERGPVSFDEPLPESYELLAELRSDASGRFEVRLASAPGHQLVLLAEQSDERGLLVRSMLGPLLRDAWLGSGELQLQLERQAPATLTVTVEGWPVGRAGVLETSHWYPFDGTALSLRDSFEGPAEQGADLHFSVPLPRGGESMVEFRLERWPVPEPLARAEFWVRAPLRGEPSPLILRVPQRVSVEGVVRGLDAERRARVAVALLGAPVAEWRVEWLGESDRSRRPDASGNWRFEDVPLGPVTLVLYVSGESEGIEILAQHALSLAGDVTRFVLQPENLVDEPLEGRPFR